MACEFYLKLHCPCFEELEKPMGNYQCGTNGWQEAGFCGIGEENRNSEYINFEMPNRYPGENV